MRFLFVALLMLMVPLATLADDKIQPCPKSKLGLDYLTLTNGYQPLACMLAGGEEEFLSSKTAQEDYEEDLIPVWKQDLVPEIATGRIFNDTVDNMREYTPNMLLKFAELPKQGKYHSLALVGVGYRLDLALATAKKLIGGRK